MFAFQQKFGQLQAEMCVVVCFGCEKFGQQVREAAELEALDLNCAKDAASRPADFLSSLA